MALDTIITEVANELEVKVTKNIETKINKKVDNQVAKMQGMLDKALTSSDLHVKIAGKPTKKVGGNKHKTLPQLIQIAANRLPVLLVGMAGTGKTHAAEQVSEALDLDFYAMSVGAQTSKSDLMGFIHAGGQYIPSMFRKAFEHGGVFLLDEIDAGNSNVLVQLNAALSNGYCAFPDKMVEKHKDFVFMASANTYGQGASRQYVGRNQLDAATLDRFVILDWNIDDKLETSLAGDEPTSIKWLAAVRRVRTYVESEGIRALVSPRATIKGSAMLNAGMTFDQTIQAAVLGGVSIDKQTFIKDLAKREYDATVVADTALSAKEKKDAIKTDMLKLLDQKKPVFTYQVGDKVTVLPKSPDANKGDTRWVNEMDSWVGGHYSITKVEGNAVKLEDHWWFETGWVKPYEVTR